MANPIPLIDLMAQRNRLKDRIDPAIARVLNHGKFILGPEVDELETKLAEFSGAKHAVTCANGTDALLLALMTHGIGPGDAVFVPAFTFVATAEAPVLVGATPVFVDVAEASLNLDPAGFEAGLTAAKKAGLRPAAILAVDLFGQPADYEAIAKFADAHGLVLIADAAQSFGASLNGKRVGTLAAITTTSFFPAKPLGCYGDGGALFTDDEAVASHLRSIRVHGPEAAKHESAHIGMNSRLDTLQAAVLLEKLKVFPDEIEARNRIAARYEEGLSEYAIVPKIQSDRTSVWAQYTIRLPNLDREAIATRLRAKGIPTAVYYPKPLHLQTPYTAFPRSGALPISERVAGEVLSLPMHAYLDAETQDRILASVKEATRTQLKAS